MKEIKLFLILKSLSKEEMKELEKGVHSPIFNKNKRMILLFNALNYFHPKFEKSLDFKQKIFKKVFGKEVYNDLKLRRAFSQFKEIVEEVLVFLQLQKKSFTKKKLLIQFYKIHAALPLLKEKMELLMGEINQAIYPDVNFLREKALLLKEYSYLDGHDLKKDSQYLVEFVTCLNQYFVAEQCLAGADLKVLSRTLATEKELPFLKEITSMTRSIKEQSPNLELYSHLKDLVEKADESTFVKVQKLFFTHFDNLTDHDQLIIMTQLINFCTNQMNMGQIYIQPKLMELYKFGLEKEFLFNTTNQFDPVQYRNISMLAILQGDFDWAIKFLKEYELKLSVSDRLEVQPICMGYLYFYKNDYQKTIDILLQNDFRVINNILSARNLVLRSYFELFLLDRNYYSLFHAYAQSFSIYIHRQKVAKPISQRYLKLIQLLQKIATKIYNFKKITKQIPSWKSYIDNTHAIASKEWVKEKIVNLKT